MDNDEPMDWPGDDGFDDPGGDNPTPPGDDGLSGTDLNYNGLDPDDTTDVGGDPGPGGGRDSGYDGSAHDPGYHLEPEPEPEPEPDGGPEVGSATDLADELPVTDPGSEDALPGTDPDVDPLADDESWHADPFPDTLDLEAPPEPVDGMPWSDPALLGDSGTGQLGDPADGAGPPPVTDLYEYDAAEAPADSADAWGALVGSEDPATSSLARFWGPGG